MLDHFSVRPPLSESHSAVEEDTCVGSVSEGDRLVFSDELLWLTQPQTSGQCLQSPPQEACELMISAHVSEWS